MTLDRIEALLGEATPGPWEHYHAPRRGASGRPSPGSAGDVASMVPLPDARAIVASRNLMPAALAVIRAHGRLIAHHNGDEGHHPNDDCWQTAYAADAAFYAVAEENLP